MSDDWFSEFVYEVVIDKKYLTEEILAITKQEPVVLPAWDPMGALAKLWLPQSLVDSRHGEHVSRGNPPPHSETFSQFLCTDTVTEIIFRSR